MLFHLVTINGVKNVLRTAALAINPDDHYVLVDPRRRDTPRYLAAASYRCASYIQENVVGLYHYGRESCRLVATDES